jgi:hypothetical protein
MTSHYTVEVYKKDRRTKAGERLVEKRDLSDVTFEDVQNICQDIKQKDKTCRTEVHATYRAVRNLMTGTWVEERYDLPYYLSVSSETYWSS